MGGGRDAVFTHRHPTGGRNLAAHFMPWQNPAMPRLGTLAQLDFDHLHLRVTRLFGETLRVEAPGRSAAAKIATADFPDQITTVFAVIRADTAFASVMGKTPLLGALIERGNSVGTQRTEAHCRDIEN